jgi:Leucine-rich repeat (LRR) protein
MNLLTSETVEPALELLSPTLTQLDLYDNQLKAAPPALSRLTNLTYECDIKVNPII